MVIKIADLEPRIILTLIFSTKGETSPENRRKARAEQNNILLIMRYRSSL